MRRKRGATAESNTPELKTPRFTADPSHYGAYEFSPRQPLDGKRNVGRHMFVDPDGSIREVIRLNVLNDRHREDIIAFHFCMQYAEVYYGSESDRPEFYIVGRDDPWDYRYVMHDGSRFNIEICRVASRDLLKLIKAENDCSLLLMKDSLYGYEIKKIERHFPGTFPDSLVDAASVPAAKKKQFPTGAFYSPNRAFLRPPFDPRLDVKAALKEAIQKKLIKKHPEKEETHLILDNLTTHASATDFFEAYGVSSETLDSLPFLSVWLYTGYYSDDDGDNCEFALTPIKISGDLEKKFAAFLNNSPR
jgi:hypothetical protein